MKKIIILIIVTAFFLGIFSNFTFANPDEPNILLENISSVMVENEFENVVVYNVQYTASFSEDDLVFDKLMGYDIVKMKDCSYLKEIGKPMIPTKEIKIALPDGIAAKKIQVVNTQSVNIKGEYTIFPSQSPQAIDISVDETVFIPPDSQIYNYNKLYPSNLVELTGQTDLAGQGMVAITIYPIHYVPREKSLTLITSIEFIIEGAKGYICGDYLPKGVSENGRKMYENMVREMIINPDDVELQVSNEVPQQLGVDPGDYDYVIITPDSWVSTFQSLADWKTKKGIPTNIVSTSWIYNNGGYSGTNQQKIRSFIQDAHSNWGTIFFLLGGDTNYIPYYSKLMYTQINGWEYVPTDTYYADYDDDWVCEVHVGRASVYHTGNSAGGIANFVNKILTYEKNPPVSNYAKKIALFGFDLNSVTDGEDCKIDINSLYIPSGWSVTTVYDSHSGNHEDAVDAAVNNGQNLINHIDHSNEYYMGTGSYNHNWGLTTSEVDAFFNGNKQSTWYSISCWACAYDYSNCIGEHFVRDADGGGVAFIGNSRSGWFYSEYDDYLSLRYDRYFFRSFFDQGHSKLGVLFSDHKMDAYNSMTPDNFNKYVFTELTLLGDPEMPIWTENPSNLVVSHPYTLPITPSLFTVHVETTSGSNVNNAFVCLWKGDEIYELGYTSSTGDVTFTISPFTLGTMYVTVTKHNYIPSESVAQVTDNYEPDDIYTEANWIETDNTKQFHNFHIPGDYDWVKFNATSQHTYAIETSDLGLDSDTILYLYGTDGTTLIDWDDDGGSGLSSRIEWTCPINGIYYAMVKHWNNFTSGPETYYNLSILIENFPPNANFNVEPSNPTTQDIIYFNDTSFDSDGNIINWTWDFGEGNTSNLQNPTHQYADDGTYTVTLNVTDDDGASGTITKGVTVLPPPDIVYVDDDYTSSTPGWGYDHFDVIQDGIDAVEGSIVYVYSGTYYENVVVDKTINLTGENRDTTIIDSDGDGDVVYVSADWVNISGFTIQNSGNDTEPSDAGIETESNYNTISNNIIENNCRGIYSYRSNNNSIFNNLVIENKDNGIFLHYSIGEKISGNTIANNTGSGININYMSFNNSIYENQIFNNTRFGFVFFTSSNNTIYDNNISSNNREGINLHNCDYNTIRNNTFMRNNETAIYLWNSSNNTINKNTIMNNTFRGISINGGGATDNIISWNNISKNKGDGISLYLSHANQIYSNIVIHNNPTNTSFVAYGVSLHLSYNNTIHNNVLTDHPHGGGISISSSYNNTLFENTITNNSEYIVFNRTFGSGIELFNSSNNTIYHNNLANNGLNACDDGNNTWYKSTLNEGNYWDDYTGTDSDGDGIGDTPYDIPGGSNQDMYPLGYFHHPIANFTYAPINPTTQDAISFTDTSIDPDGIIANWTWDFDDGNINYLQNPTHQYTNKGTYTVTLNVTDDDGAANETTQQIVVANIAPVANDDYYNIVENGSLYISAPGILENDTDAEDDPLTAIKVSDPSNGVLTLFDNGSFEYTPTVGYNGTDSFTYKAFDGIDYSNEATVTIWVISNHPPYTPSNPSPSDGKTNVDKNKILSWFGGDPDSGDTVTYDVFFGTSNPPSKTSSNQSGTNYDPGAMSYNTKYYWKIIAWDKNDTSAEGPIWSFTSEKESTQPPYNPPYNPPPTNQDPIANASASETLGFINTPVIFDGSLSSDEDGSITNYTWNFGDETTGYDDVTTHVYVIHGEYIVTLTVTDNEGATDDDTSTVVISKPNIPPTAPEIDGASSGTQNTDYIYSAVSTDADNDTIKYIFDWGDGETTTTDFLSNGAATTQTHNWTTAGEYTISVKAYDNETESGTAEYTVLIDVWLIDDEIKGYLVDEDGDGTYDLFDNSETGEKINVEKQDDGTYLIDIDGDGNWDHTFSMAEGLSIYQGKENKDTPGFELILFVCALIFILFRKRKRFFKKIENGGK